MSIASNAPKGGNIECPAIRYFFHVIANTLQACGEFTRVNEDEMLILAKAAQVDTDITPNLGTMLLFHLTRQAHQHHGPITCGGVITVLANSLGVDLSSLAQLIGERVVGTTTLRATGMITQQHGRTFIRILVVAELFPIPMPNLFSIEEGILHYVGQE